jgi:hypothetical protein
MNGECTHEGEFINDLCEQCGRLVIIDGPHASLTLEDYEIFARLDGLPGAYVNQTAGRSRVARASQRSDWRDAKIMARMADCRAFVVRASQGMTERQADIFCAAVANER